MVFLLSLAKVGESRLVPPTSTAQSRSVVDTKRAFSRCSMHAWRQGTTTLTRSSPRLFDLTQSGVAKLDHFIESVLKLEDELLGVPGVFTLLLHHAQQRTPPRAGARLQLQPESGR